MILMFKLFNIWDTSEVAVKDLGIKNYVNLTPIIIPHSGGRHVKQFGKSEMPIVERLINRITVAGHEGRKHKRTSGRNTGKKNMAMKIVKNSFQIIEKKTKKNPVQVYVDALGHAAPREETTRLKYGGIAYHQSVDVAPQRRIDQALRFISVGAMKSSFKKKKSMAQALAEELIAASNYDIKCHSISKKEEQERIAKAAR